MQKDQNNPIRQEKIRKLKELWDKGVNPYPHNWNKKRSSSQELAQKFAYLKAGEEAIQFAEPALETPLLASEKHSASQYCQKPRQQGCFHIAGRLMRKRPMGKAAFFNVQDEEGELQCYIRRDDFSAGASEAQNPPVQSDGTAKKRPLNPWELWKLCDIGDIVGLSGTLFKTRKGELSLKIQDLEILCKTVEVLPEKYHGLEDKELKYRRRHLDLIMDRESRKVFQTRSKIIHEIRSFMHKKHFMEVETPVLQPLYGGALAQPFETHFRRLNQKMYLKISPEIYLKQLIVGGFEKVFEIGKNFRNEGIDRSHNPEFTMMEYYEAYTDYEDQIKQFEELVCHVVKKVKGSLKFQYQVQYQGRELDFSPPWASLRIKDFEDLICAFMRPQEELKEESHLIFEFEGQKPISCKEFWEDIQLQLKKFREGTAEQDKKEEGRSTSDPESSTKEDIHIQLKEFGDGFVEQEKKEGGQLANNPESSEKEEGHPANNSEPVKKKMTRRQIDHFWRDLIEKQRRKLIEKYKTSRSDENRGLNRKSDENKGLKSSVKKYESLLAYAKRLDPEGDFKKFDEILYQINLPESSQLEDRMEELALSACEQTVEKYFWDPLFIIDFPLQTSPLTKQHRKNPRLVERFEPYIAGMEIGNAYTELNNPVEQRQRLEGQQRWSESEGAQGQSKNFSSDEGEKLDRENSLNSPSSADQNLSHPVDENFLHALEVGMPPTGGVGLGIERLVMILTDQNNIKDSMLFPMLRSKT